MSQALLVSPREGYRLWAATFDRDPSAVIALETRLMQPLLPDWKSRRVVDVGCGTGRWSAWLSERGARIWGFDLCPEMLARAAGKPGLRGSLAACDAACLPLPDACADGGICALTAGHLRDPHALAVEIARVTRPGGTVLWSDFHPDAVRRGWKRTFRTAEGLHELQTHAYSVPGLLDAAARAGLEADVLLEAGFGELERPIFARAGREALFEDLRGLPAVLVVRWRKRSAW